MEIINKRGEVNLSKWMEKTKDSCGLIKWGCKCAWSWCTYCLNIFPITYANAMEFIHDL